MKVPRYHEHVQRTAQLLNLCLTCERFAGLAEPVLNSSHIVWPGNWVRQPDSFIPVIPKGDWPEHTRSICLLNALLEKPTCGKWIRSLESVAFSINKFRSEHGVRKCEGDTIQSFVQRSPESAEVFQCHHITGWEQACATILKMVKRVWQDKADVDWARFLQAWPGDVLFALFVALSPNLAHLAICF